ncbi:MAG: metallophosphoesterase [Myxococcota bacterium]
MTPRIAFVVALAAVSLGLGGCSTVLLVEEVRQNGRLFGRAPDPEVPNAKRIRFAAVGDFGLDIPAQRVAAANMRRRCDGRCDFTLLLGDNLYWSGISEKEAEADTNRLACLIRRYPGPKYAVLGNHDYHPVFPDAARSERQLAFFAEAGDDVRGAFHFYTFNAGNHAFWAIDSNLLVRAVALDENVEVRAFGASAEREVAGWKIGFGHHPLISNGYHGNAGRFRESDRFALWSGKALRRFFLEHFAGRLDLYLSGHEHSLQFHAPVFGTKTAVVVSGSGGKCTPRASDPKNLSPDGLRYEHYGYGFAIVDAGPRLEVRYYDLAGNLLWGASRGRGGPWVPLEGFARIASDPRAHCVVDRETASVAEANRTIDPMFCGTRPSPVP